MKLLLNQARVIDELESTMPRWAKRRKKIRLSWPYWVSRCSGFPYSGVSSCSPTQYSCPALV